MNSERGMTLIEVLVSMVIFTMVMGGAVSVLRSQSQGYTKGADRMTVLQNVRFAATTLEMDLRVVGAGVPDVQPYLVYAGTDVIAFNANYTTNVANDPFAVYYDPDAPNGLVTALPQTQQITIPLSSFSYPDTTYIDSEAETVVFFFDADTGTARTDDFILYRQINTDNPQVVARDILRDGTNPFFQYSKVVTLPGGASQIQTIPTGSLPLAHTAAIHLSPSDTANAAAIDSIRGVRVTMTATNGSTGPDEHRRTITRLIGLPNAGIANSATCGDVPLPMGTLGAAAGIDVTTLDRYVRLTWGPATDEVMGEKDVVRYVIWRRNVGDPSWGDPYLSIPSGLTTYFYDDMSVQIGQILEYQIAAQDCTPALSTRSTSGPVPVL